MSMFQTQKNILFFLRRLTIEAKSKDSHSKNRILPFAVFIWFVQMVRANFSRSKILQASTINTKESIIHSMLSTIILAFFGYILEVFGPCISSAVHSIFGVLVKPSKIYRMFKDWLQFQSKMHYFISQYQNGII